MKKKKLNLFEGVRKELYQERQDWINNHSDYFIYETDDLEQFDTLDDAIKYVNSPKGQEANEIIRIQIIEDETDDDYEFSNGVTLDDEVVWTRKDGRVDEKLLKEGTSNFKSLDGGLPLLVFYTYDEVFAMIDNDSEAPKYDDFENKEEYFSTLEDFEQKYFANLDASVLDEGALDDLGVDLDNLNGEIEGISYALEEEADELDYDEKNKDKVNKLQEQAGILGDIKFDIESGYYEAAQIVCNGDSYFKDLDKEYQDFILNKLKEIKDKYNLTQLDASYRFSNGETGYHKVKSSKEDKVSKGRVEYCVMKDGDNIECFSALDDAIKFAEEEKANQVREVTYDKPNKYGDEAELSSECVWINEIDENKKDKRKTPVPKNTDPKRNMEIFNHMMGSDKYGEDSSESSDGISCSESMETKDIKYDGSLEDIANFIDKLNNVVMAFVDGEKVKVQCVWHTTRRQAHSDYVKVSSVLHDYEKEANLSRRLDIRDYSLEWRDEDKECAVKFNVYSRNKIKGLEESKEDSHYIELDKLVKELGVSDDEIKKVIKIADDYEAKAQRHFITYGQMDEVAKAMGLKEMSDGELARAWKVYYYVLQRESLSDEGGALKKWKKYGDAASAFAEVINREARERKEKFKDGGDK